LHRRQLLATACLLPLAGCRLMPERELINPCLGPALPAPLARHEVVLAALEGLNTSGLWDAHVHLLGTGDGGSGAWVNPAMRSLLHPLRMTQFHFYMNAACLDSGGIDEGYTARLHGLLNEMPAGVRAMLLAFDYVHDDQGHPAPSATVFHTPDHYARDVARRSPDRFEWIASIHPYREDAVGALRRAAADGARAVKWLPPVMEMDPGSPRCDAFYAALRETGLPLLVHCGEERAVHGASRQDLGNPLRLRRPLEQGVTIVVAHCASLGTGIDLDAGAVGPILPNIELFARLMDEHRHEGLLFGEISALTQRNRFGRALETIVHRRDWHHRLINGSDYPLPAVMPLFSVREMAERGYLDPADVPVLRDLRRYNALWFDLVLKRRVRIRGDSFDPIVFESRRVFDAPGQGGGRQSEAGEEQAPSGTPIPGC
jgi:predicted TIM-barrel fold metal-dependent hydrolase